MPNINLQGIRFETFVPEAMPEDYWQGIWDVRDPAWREAFHGSRTPEEITVFLGNENSYREATEDPNVLVGERFNPNQEYDKPLITLALEGKRPVGFVKTADNVSGETEEVRAAKLETRRKRYRTAMS